MIFVTIGALSIICSDANGCPASANTPSVLATFRAVWDPIAGRPIRHMEIFQY